MKRIVLLLSLLMLAVFALTAETVRLGNGDNSVSVLSSTQSETTLQYQITKFEKASIEINGNEWYQIRLADEGVSQDKGLPELPVFNRSIIIDNSALMKLEVSDVRYQDFSLPVAPSKGVITRNIDPYTVPYTFDKVYQGTDFYPGKVAELSNPYIMRDFRGITIKTVPFAYNPETRILRVFTSYRIRVYTDGPDRVNTLSSAPSSISRDFAPLYENHFLNWQNFRYTPVNDTYGKLIVICHTNYMSTILPYVNWKKQKGIQTELVEWSTIGTTAAQLQTYIQNRYTADPTIAYIQLVGDAPQIPSLTSGGGGSDPTFSLVAGSDNYPDIFIGRFSAETTAQVTAQINKAIVYERDLTTSATWLSNAIGISDQATTLGDDSETDINHMNNIRTKLMNYGYTTVDQIYEPSATSAAVTTNVNAGRGFINYVGHGSDTSWVTTGFSNTEATALSNGNKTPIIMDVACVNGNFVSITCYAEAWMRNANGGSAAIYASSINQSWSSPMRAQDHFTDLLVAGTKTTAGGLYYNASCNMMDIYGNTTSSDGVNMFLTWHIFGDASLMVRSKTPIAMTVTHPSNIVSGTTSIAVSTGIANTLVAITNNNTIYGRGFTDTSGNVTITLTSPPSGTQTYTITATASNRVTYVGSIAQTVASGPWMEVTAANYIDGGNNTPEYNESGTLNVTYYNSGTTAATAVTATLTCSTTGITITDNTDYTASLAAGASSTVTGAYAFSIANNIANGTVANFTITMVGTSTWTYNFSKTINAPVLTMGTMVITDPSPGNANGRLDPGETVTVTMPLNNTGAAASPAGSATLTCVTTGITVNTGTANFSAISAAGTTNLSFSITAASSMTIGTVASLVFNATAGAYTATKTENVPVGLITETFETGNFASFAWIQGTTPWVIVNTGAYAGTYAAKSGTITASGSTTMETTRILSSSGTLTFWYKVSSESGYDYLKFYVDGVIQNGTGWSGEIAWTQASYALAVGTHILKWEYMKDTSVDSGSDCAWVDSIVFPASTAPSSFYPPQNFAAAPGNAVANLSWAAPLTGTPTGYKIFKDSSLLTTVTGLSYSDTAVTNGTTYSYYLKAVYTGGESDATATINVTPSSVVPTSVIIGTGTSSNVNTAACPINTYYQSLHGQSVYTAAELNALGVYGPINITQLGFNITALPTLTMPNFIVRMVHTTSTNVASWIPSTGMTTVYTAASYLPTATGWNMLTLSTPFTWNGTSNIAIDTAYGLIGSYVSSGTTQYTTVTSGYRYVRLDTADQTNVFTGGSTSTNRPNVKLTLLAVQTGPYIAVNPTSVTASAYPNATTTATLTINNTGGTAMTWSTGATISTWGTVAPTSGTIAGGGSTALTMTLNSTGLAAGPYTSNMTITSNATNNTSLSVPVTFTVLASPYPAAPRYVAEWEPATGAIVRYALGLPYNLLANISQTTKLYVVVASASQSACATALSSNGVNMSNVYYINATTDTYWIRDYGPWYIFDGSTMKIVDFTYNRPRPNDDVIPVTLANYFGLNYYSMPLNATGGNVMTDGNGKMMSTNLILEENDGNSSTGGGQVTEYTYTEAQIKQMAQNYLGVTDYQFYTDPNNTYIDHIDCWGKLLDVDKVIIRSVPTSHAQYSAIEATVAAWQTKTTSYGTPFHIYRVYTPNDEPYSNSYILNKTIYVPQMGTANDAAAIAVYQAAMPGYTILGYTAGSAAWESTDAIHCRINAIYDTQMIHLWHTPLTSAVANSTIPVTVEIKHANALTAAQTYVAYKHTPTGTWQYAPLTFVSGNNWTANITAPAYGQTLYYYILATDNTARTNTMPLCGASEPFHLVVNIMPPNSAPTIVLPDSFSYDQNTSLVVDFDPYTNDVDNNPLTLTCSGNTNVLVQIVGLSVTFTAVSGWCGTENITFTVSDGLLQTTDTVNVTVNLVQLPPPDPEVVDLDPGTAVITWPPVPYAVSYEIWVCDEPYGVYELLGVTASQQWQDDFTGHMKRFYKVIASNLLPTKQ